MTISWLLEPGATHHLTNDVDNLDHGMPYCGSHSVIIGDGNSIPIIHIGHSYVSTHSGSHIFLRNVLHTPDVSYNLDYVHKLCQDNSALIKFHANTLCVKEERTKRTLAHGKAEKGLYTINHAIICGNDTVLSSPSIRISFSNLM